MDCQSVCLIFVEHQEKHNEHTQKMPMKKKTNAVNTKKNAINKENAK